MTVIDDIHTQVVTVVGAAIEASATADQLLECARAVVATGDVELMVALAERIRDEVDELAESASSWHVQAMGSKIEGWQKTGHKANLLAQAWGEIVEPLRVAYAEAEGS